MITVLYLVVSNLAFICIGARWCDDFSGVELTRMWQIGLVELMFESPIGFKVYRRVKDKFPQSEIDKRQDKPV